MSAVYPHESMTYSILRPANLPSHLLSFEFYFENVNTRMVNLYHAAGMHLIYHVEKIIFVLPENVFYEILRLENVDERHESKYNWLLMKGAYGGYPQIGCELLIDNGDETAVAIPPELDDYMFQMEKLPEPGNGLALKSRLHDNLYYHLICNDVFQNPATGRPVVSATFSGSYDRVAAVINLLCNEENQFELLKDDEVV